MNLQPGEVVRWSFSFGGRLSSVCPMRVVEHTADGLLLWLAGRSPVWEAVVPGGRHLRDVPPEDQPVGGYPLAPGHWHENGALILQPEGAAHAVWWLFSPESDFTGWYVNLEHRTGNGPDIRITDLELDLTVAPDRSWRWKDEQSFADKTGHPAYWTPEQAAAVRAEGIRVAARVEAGAFPFDGRWCDFRPPTEWALPPRPVPPSVGAFRPAAHAENGLRRSGEWSA
ncbi:DUF402 domain-containing protein [Kitasatospora sp. NPDC050543]|uniref:DUF402 domain-containing protein n=1 Tax=Kitasatospora sp. NPDC050543 TaxID=3364054 RepID=UPI0037911E6A